MELQPLFRMSDVLQLDKDSWHVRGELVEPKEFLPAMVEGHMDSSHMPEKGRMGRGRS